MTDTDQEHLSLEVELSAAVETGEEQTAGETAAVKIPEDGGSGAEAGVLSFPEQGEVEAGAVTVPEQGEAGVGAVTALEVGEAEAGAVTVPEVGEAGAVTVPEVGARAAKEVQED